MNPCMTPDDAMERANTYARRRYRASIVRIDTYENARYDARTRCMNSRNAMVRANADRIADFGRSYRYCRWVLSAPMTELALFAQHGLIGGGR